jgi:hypothetical protein
MKSIYFWLLLSLLAIPFRLWSQCIDTDDAVQNNTRNIKTPFGSTVQAFDWRQEFFTLNNDPIIAQKELKTMLNVVPNPFENRLTIHFALQEDSNVSISLTNAIGQVIKIQEFTQKGIGEYDEIMETNDVAPGVYYLTLQTKFGVETKKVVKQL